MRCISTTGEMQSLAMEWRRGGVSVAFVPTMGFLHEGHLALIRRARRNAERVVVSIFVNPTQFGPNEDFESYPRDEARDAGLLEAEGVDVLFLPSAGEMYPGGGGVYVDEASLSTSLCGADRPGHFRGVLTIVCKLFQIVLPDVAVFGRKDAQQAALIQRYRPRHAVALRVVRVAQQGLQRVLDEVAHLVYLRGGS